MKILTGSDATVTSPTFVAADGYTPSDTDATATVSVASAAGQTLTVSAVSNLASPVGAYTVTVQGLTNPDLLTLTWAGKVSGVDQQYVQTVDVVGGVYASLAELVAVPGIDHPTKHSTARILELRDEFEELVEEYTGKTLVPRFARSVLRDGLGLLPHRPVSLLLTVTDADDQDVEFADWQLSDTGMVLDPYSGPIYSYGRWPLTVGYVHGEAAPPARIKNACKEYVRARLLADGNRVGRDTLRQTDPSGITEQFSTPDWSAGRPTGYLNIDRDINSLGRRAPALA